MAELGHFERLSFAMGRGHRSRQQLEVNKVAHVAEALTRAANMNPNLKYLDLSDTGTHDSEHCVNWVPHFPMIFKAVEMHKGLRTLVVRNYPLYDDSNRPDYSLLERLLSRNRNITVLDDSGNRISNGTSIDKLYALNHLFNGSAALVKESASLRSLLTETALVECKLDNFQRTGLLLSHHMDVLCDLIQYDADLEDLPVSRTDPEETDLIESATKKMRTSE